MIKRGIFLPVGFLADFMMLLEEMPLKYKASEVFVDGGRDGGKTS